MTLPQRWADELGMDSTAAVTTELRERFEHLSRFVLADDMPRAGEVSAEAATAYGDFCILVGFLADAHAVLTRKETHR
ncbi:hypothetical protein ACFVWG_41445 [Kribbella sp. NPDC058245]|uniref:hypothetical protein n=1 Tax=Kribbella sp. NPDC058245 TaxID=3346399 RepID=UPI0036E59993